MSGLRRAIAEQVVAAKELFLRLPQVCPYHGIALTADDSHVDHQPPTTFANLASGWLRRQGIDVSGVHISIPADNQHITEMVDRQQKSSWQEFHRTHATLRLISQKANLSDVRKSSSR